MKRKTSLGKCGRAGVALLVIVSGAGAVLGQQEVWLQQKTNANGDTLGLVQEAVPPDDSALTSVEQGKPNLDQAFDWRQWQLEKRRSALEDTEFLINLRTFYFDRSDFSGAEKQ